MGYIRTCRRCRGSFRRCFPYSSWKCKSNNQGFTDDKHKKNCRETEINGPFNIQYIAKNNEIKVIECNLRVIRSFPFVSKVKDINFIRTATRIMIGAPYEIKKRTEQFTGVKVPQFSFNRLANADNR